MILIIANARRKGGLSGSDNIYLAFVRYWDFVEVWHRLEVDFKPFWLCYIWRIIIGCLQALFCFEKYEFVYSASDFWMDALPAWILKLKGNKWAAGYYLNAPRKNKAYLYSQNLMKFFIKHFADTTCMTNERVYEKSDLPNSAVFVHGGVDLNYAGLSVEEKIYDAVFIGRFHHTKGIDELMKIWDKVLKCRPSSTLAIIGGGDDKEKDIKAWAERTDGVHLLGYMGIERFDIFKKSKIVLYPSTYDHFSFGPVEAMACGCPMIAFNLSVMAKMEGLKGCALVHDFDTDVFAGAILDYIVGRWVVKSVEAVKYAQTWDWKVRAPKVLEQIRSLI